MSISAVVVSSSFRAQAYARAFRAYAPGNMNLALHANLVEGAAGTLRHLDDSTEAQQLDAANVLSTFTSRGATLCESHEVPPLVIADMIDACRTFNVDAGELIGEILVNR